MKNKTVLLLFFSCVSFGQINISESKIEVIDKELFRDLIEKKIQIIDVRTEHEYKDDHIENATNINYKSSNFIEAISVYDKTKPYLIYCKSGNRSGKAAKIMDSLGFVKIYDLKGGFTIW
jgi:rhodanese-related sulfurtransferase|tara:strand:+ start:2911 stop:3270 length:360 start_codon:yes stop_codon:yes gene_type:complete